MTLGISSRTGIYRFIYLNADIYLGLMFWFLIIKSNSRSSKVDFKKESEHEIKKHISRIREESIRLFSG